MNNNLGEQMPLNPPIPIVTDMQVRQVVDFVAACKPEEATFSDIEAVLSWLGRFLLGGYPIPTETITWIRMVPQCRLIACEILANAVLANAFHMQAKRVESAFFALTALLDFFNWSIETPKEKQEEPHADRQK